MSLSLRLGLWLAAGLALLFVLHGFITERAPRVMTEDYITTRLEHDAEWLLNGLDEHGHLTAAHIPAIFLRPNSGHYFALHQGERELNSASSGKDTLPLPIKAGVSHGAWRDGEPLLLLRRDLPHGGALVVAESLSDLNAHLAQFKLRFVLISLGLFAVLLVAQFVLLRFVLRPMRDLARDGARLQQGELERLPVPAMRELQPLSHAFNAVLESQARRLARSRHALADLAHGLKTPLAALRQTLHPQSDPQALAAVARLEGIVQRELRHARWSAGSSSANVMLDAAAELRALVQAMRLIHRERGLRFELNLPQTLMWRMDREDLHELCGNLLDNAAKWAKSVVILSVVAENSRWRIQIEDDGAGADVALLNAEWTRGRRLDESTPGTGLGLAIVGEIVAAYEGDLSFAASESLGGLCACVSLPRATILTNQ
jgi:signal transduction histidine kinase